MTSNSGRVTGASTNIHFHENGAAAVQAASDRARNTTIIIGADQDKGALLIDIDVQADVCSGADELKQHLAIILEALDGYNPFGAS